MSRTDVTSCMPPAPYEITRDDLLAFLRREGFQVSPYQLLRWHDWGLLPQPRREGKGRGEGSVSYYPRMAGLQARALASLLAKRRSLIDAGWGLWALGFSVTDWARDLLLSELRARHGDLKRASRSLSGKRGQLTRLLSRSRSTRELKRMRKVAKPEAMPRLFRMMVDFQLGTLRAEDYSDLEWAGFQDATLHEFLPAIADDPELPSAQEVAEGLARLSAQISVGRTISGLKALLAQQMEQYRNEAQWLLEMLSPPEKRSDAIISREDFLSFFKARHLNPDGERDLVRLMRALGQTRPPASPLQRWLKARRTMASCPANPNP
jgi:hypothetical protein